MCSPLIPLRAAGVSYMINIFPTNYSGAIPARRYLHANEFMSALSRLGFTPDSVVATFAYMERGKDRIDGPIPLSEFGRVWNTERQGMGR